MASERPKPPPPPSAPEPVSPLPAVPEPELPPLPVPDQPWPVADPLPTPLPEPVIDPEAAPGPELEPASPEAPTPEAETPPVATEGDELPATPEVTTATQTDGGNVNVSVRVDSPGTEAPVVQETPEPTVISPPAQPDITPAAGIVTPDPAAPETVAPETPIQSDATNTNVAVRVLSPGDNDPVTQTNAAPDPADEASGEEDSSPSDTAESTSDPLADSEQYQTPNSQYQSSDDPKWIWNWTLSMCDGIVSSISDESGDRSSRDWTWNWIWNWTCEDTPVSADSPSNSPLADTTEDRGSGVPQSGPANVNVSIRVLSPGDDGPVTQTNTSPAPASLPAGSGEPSWLWSWTFNWCGTTTAILTPAGEGSGLEWTWNWVWLWDCQPLDAPAPDQGETAPVDTGGDTAPPVSSSPAPIASGGEISPSIVPQSGSDGGGGPAPSLVPTWVQPAATLEWVFRVPWATANDLPAPLRAPRSVDFAAATGNTVAIPWPAFPASPVMPAVEVDIVIPSVAPSAPAMPALPAVATQTPTGTIQIVIDTGAPTPDSVMLPAAPTMGARLPDPRSAGVGDRMPHTERTESEASAVTATAAPGEPSVERRPAPRAEATARAPRDSSGGRLPFEFPPPLQVAGSSTSTGGVVPSLLTFGLATVIGFFAFAAPGLGRRIRLARTPSPRSRSHSPLDNPG